MNKCKKIIIPILIIAMFFMCIPKTEYAANTTLKIGDINGDGAIDSRDTLKELEYIASSTIPSIAKKHPNWKTYIEKKWIVEATGIVLDKTKLNIEKGKTVQLKATITPENASNKVVTWSSTDTKIATVDGIGNVEGKNVGIAIITATTKNGKSAKCEVKITEAVAQTSTSKATTPQSTTSKTTTPKSTPTKNISNLNIMLKPNVVTYNGKAQTPVVTIKDGNTVLKNGTNYTLSYSRNINAGIALITITGKGNYTGTTTKTFNINKATYNMNNVKFANSTVTYDGKSHSIIATGVPTGVKVTYIGNGKTAVGTYTITAKFTGDKTNYNIIADRRASLKINPKAINNAKITGIQNKKYTGKSITQNIVVKDGNKTLKNGTDYTVKYKNNVKVGKATVTIEGKGNYFGTILKTFNITKNTTESNNTNKNSKKNNSINNSNNNNKNNNNKNNSNKNNNNNKNNSNKNNKDKSSTKNKEIAVTGIKMNKSYIRLKVGKSAKLTATILPNNATNKSIQWSTANYSIVSIDQNGNIEAKKPGITTVCARSKYNSSKITYCIVQVVK